MQRLQWAILASVVAAVMILAGGLRLVENFRYNLRLEVTEQLQIEEYLLLSAEMTALYSEYGRLTAGETPKDAAGIDDLRRRVDELLLAIQSQVARRSIEDARQNDTVSVEHLNGPSSELVDLTLEIERTLSEIERAETLISDGALEAAEEVLRETLDGRLERYLLPAIDSAIKRERAREIAALDKLNGLLAMARIGVISVAVILGLAALMLWFGVLRPQRAALAQVERQMERLRGGLETTPVHPYPEKEFAAISSAISEATAARDAQTAKLDALATELATREAALRSEKDSLREVDQVRRDFLADVSHELRTPLTVLRGVAEVSLRGQTTDAADFRSAMQRIVDEAGHVSRIVEDLFFIARSRAGGLDLRTDILDLSDVLSATAREAGTLASVRDATVDWAVTDEEILIEGDTGRLRQLFTILLDNALKYGGARPRVEASFKVAGGEVTISVRDYGPGVPDEDLPHVFDRLFRGVASQRAAPSGSGLGLPMARTIVEGHGGHIALDNAPDGGAVVTVTLPVFDEDALEEAEV